MMFDLPDNMNILSMGLESNAKLSFYPPPPKKKKKKKSQYITHSCYPLDVKFLNL